VSPSEITTARSLALHEAVCRAIERDADTLRAARARVDRWIAGGSVPRPYAEGWSRILAGSPAEVCSALVERSERMNDLRQVSPFAGTLDARERWRVLRDVERRSA
jgi:hypothetical protein